MNAVVVQGIEGGDDDQRDERPHRLFRAGADNGLDAADKGNKGQQQKQVVGSKWPLRGYRQGIIFMADSGAWRSKGLSVMVQAIAVSAHVLTG